MGATTAIILTVGSAINDASAQQKQGRALRRQADFEAGELERQAEDVIFRGDFDAKRLAQLTRGDLGTARAGFAGQGVITDVGSAADVGTNISQLSALDQATIRNNAARESLGLTKQADLVRMGGRNAQQGMQRAAFGTLLGGAGRSVDIWRTRNK